MKKTKEDIGILLGKFSKEPDPILIFYEGQHL